MTQRKIPAGFIAAGSQVLSLANSTALGLNSTTIATGANSFHFSVETQPARYGFNSTAPTLSTGVLLAKDTDYLFESVADPSTLLFQRTTGTCVINIQAYTRAGG